MVFHWNKTHRRPIRFGVAARAGRCRSDQATGARFRRSTRRKTAAPTMGSVDAVFSPGTVMATQWPRRPCKRNLPPDTAIVPVS